MCAPEILKIASNGQWSLEKSSDKSARVKVSTEDKKPLKAKLLSEKQLAGRKLKATGAKIEAVRQLKEKNPDVDWDEKLASSLEELQTLLKAYINNPNVPKGSCDCGAHATNSSMHSDWCDGLKGPAKPPRPALERAKARFDKEVKLEHIKYDYDGGHAYSYIDHPAASIKFDNSDDEAEFEDHKNNWLYNHDDVPECEQGGACGCNP
jgi:hypothetical protein